MENTDQVVKSATIGSVLGAIIVGIIATCFSDNTFSFKVALKDKDIEGEIGSGKWKAQVTFHQSPPYP